MTGAKITVTTEGNLDKALDELLRNMGQARAAMKNVGEYIQSSHEERFKNEEGPDGQRWAENAASTKKRKRNPKILQEFGQQGGLLGTMSYKASALDVEYGSPKDYVAIHHFGGKAGRNRSVNIVARPIFGISSDDKQEIGEILSDHIFGFGR